MTPDWVAAITGEQVAAVNRAKG